MATIEIEGKKYPVRPLTRGEIKKLRSAGLWVTQIAGTGDEELGENHIDAVLEMVIGGTAALNLPNPEANRLYMAVIEATYGSAAAEKNSLRSGTGPTTRSEPGTAASAGATAGSSACRNPAGDAITLPLS